MLIPRRDAFDTYWRFVAERQSIFNKRRRGEPGPWTTDSVLLKHRFCNVFRASDRVSQALIANIYRPGFSTSFPDIILRTLLFRMFNNVQTAEYLEFELGEPLVSTFDVDSYVEALDLRAATGANIFNGAYIQSGNKAYGYDKKHGNHIALVQHMISFTMSGGFSKTSLVRKLEQAVKFEDVYKDLLEYPLIGKFMAYQLATDLNYTPVIDFDEDSFTMAGPGAERGIAKCFESTGGLSNEYVIRWMVDMQEVELEKRGFDLNDVYLFGQRQLKNIDAQNCFCETDKICRVKFPELASDRTRIKSSFTPVNDPIAYAYPPKWGIDTDV